METRVCTKCGKELPVTEFHRSSGRPAMRCKACKKAYDVQYRKDTREKRRVQQAAYKKSHRALVNELSRRYVASNPEARKASTKRYYEANRAKINAHSSKYNAARRDEVNAARRRRYAERREEYRAKAREDNRKKYATDPAFAMLKRLRVRALRALSGKAKAGKTIDLLGCTPAELVAHLESKFASGMTWDNRSKWHVDHILPCAIFDLADPVEQKQCFHYTNLQPLWAHDNQVKGARVAA